MSSNDISTAIAAKLANIATVRDASATEVDSIPVSPYAVIAAHSGQVEPGNWEHLIYSFPVRIYVERLGDDARTFVSVNDLLDAVIAEFRSGVQLGGTVAQSVVTAWNTDLFAEIGTSLYWVPEFTIAVIVAQGRSYVA